VDRTVKALGTDLADPMEVLIEPEGTEMLSLSFHLKSVCPKTSPECCQYRSTPGYALLLSRCG